VKLMCRTFDLTVDSIGLAGVAGPVARHAESCVDCGVVLAAMRVIDGGLRSLDSDYYRAPDTLQPAVMASLGPGLAPEHEHRMSLKVPVAAAVVATAAAGTAVIVRLLRTRAA
jgi:hypothetical protein